MAERLYGRTFMKLNRLFTVLAILGCGLFVSNYGGNISYGLFYLSIFIPVTAFLYTLYVYFRFKIYQSMEKLVVVKGEWNQYSFIIANEDYLSFRNVKVNFFTDKSTIEDAGQMTEYCLLPDEKEKLETRIKCNYRGEYYVGGDSIVVTDFLYLFTITYPIASKLKVVVLPRIVELAQLGIAPLQIDVKNPLRSSNQAEEELDTELRKYYPGDTRKRIHWKASAKKNELLSRKYYNKPKAEIVLFMDLLKVKEDELSIVIIEDKIIESILAIANHYIQRGIRSHIHYDKGGHTITAIASMEDFQSFYRACAKFQFEAELPISVMISERVHRGGEGDFFVVATHLLSEELYLASLPVIGGGNHLCILLISDDMTEESKALTLSLRQAGVEVYQIMSGDEIEDVLRGGRH